MRATASPAACPAWVPGLGAAPAHTPSPPGRRTPKLRLVGAPVVVDAPLEQMPVPGGSPFDAAGRMAIFIGGRDSRFGLEPTGWSGGLCAVLLGIRGPRPLADPALEALRRLVLALRRRPRTADAAIAAARAAGVSQAKAEFLLARFLGRPTPTEM